MKILYLECLDGGASESEASLRLIGPDLALVSTRFHIFPDIPKELPWLGTEGFHSLFFASILQRQKLARI